MSNRVYSASSAVPAPAWVPIPPSTPVPCLSDPLKPDLSLTGWFLHIKPFSSAPPSPTSTVLLKGILPSNEPWVTGYVLERHSPPHPLHQQPSLPPRRSPGHSRHARRGMAAR